MKKSKELQKIQESSSDKSYKPKMTVLGEESQQLRKSEENKVFDSSCIDDPKMTIFEEKSPKVTKTQENERSHGSSSTDVGGDSETTVLEEKSEKLSKSQENIEEGQNSYKLPTDNAYTQDERPEFTTSTENYKKLRKSQENIEETMENYSLPIHKLFRKKSGKLRKSQENIEP